MKDARSEQSESELESRIAGTGGASAFLSLVKQRRSIRRFSDRPVDREKVLTCLEAARLAPSADNVQPWRFFVIDEPELKERFSREVFSGIYSNTRFAARAPVLILLLARLDIVANWIGEQIQGIKFHCLDLGIAGEHLVLQAEDLGLGTCWIGWFNTRRARKIAGIPKTYRIISLMALGYPESRPVREKKKKSLSEIAWFNSMGKSA